VTAEKEVPRTVKQVIADARKLAVEYYQLTGRPLGITSEIGEFETARLLHLKLAPPRERGYDATDKRGRKLQIKARRIPLGKEKASQRIGAIDIEKPWDACLLILMNHAFEPQVIYEVGRRKIIAEIKRPGSKARNEWRALSADFFKKAGIPVWKAKRRLGCP
jgi:hypothetical protein